MSDPLDPPEEQVALDINTIASNTELSGNLPGETKAEGLWKECLHLQTGYGRPGPWQVKIQRYRTGADVQTLEYTTNEEPPDPGLGFSSNLNMLCTKSRADFFDGLWAPSVPGDYFTLKIWKPGA